ncbi:MAG: CPBP family intramembrane glutamic endopeptidase [Bryobacter sp.]|nr:CPBP family intramembrane glutamic endopeptidase [Bryobacter sp.]
MPEGTGFRILFAAAAIMRSFGALLAMISAAVLAELTLLDALPTLPIPRETSAALLRAVPELLFFLLVTWLLLRLDQKAKFLDLGLHWNVEAVKDVLLFGALGALALGLLVLPLVWAGGGVLRFTEQRVQNWEMFTVCTALLFVGSMAEEILLRGYAFQTLVKPLHLLGALIFANGIFAGLHLANPGANEYSIANTFLAGCVLGLLVVVRRSLWPAVGAHFGWNLMTPLVGVKLSGMSLPLTGAVVEWKWDDLWTGGNYGPEAGVPCLVLLLGLLFWLVRLFYQQQETAPPAIPLPPASGPNEEQPEEPL